MKTKTIAAVSFAVVFPVTALCSDYPTAPEKKDKLCEAIGETSKIAVQPRDRVWFGEQCRCLEGVGCGAPGSRRFSARIENQKKTQARARAAQAKALAEQTARERQVAEELTAIAGEAGDPLEPYNLQRLREKLEDTCLHALHRLKGRGPDDIIGDTVSECDRLVGVEIERRHQAAEKEAEARAKALEQERSEKLPGLQVEAQAACKEFRACMNLGSPASCWGKGGPGERYEAVCKEYSRLDGSVPWRCQNKSTDDCAW